MMRRTPRSPGVYLIWNNQTMKFYIGSTTNLRKRFSDHNWKLKNNNYQHSNPELQADYLLYGSDAFEFIVAKQFANIDDARACEKNLLEEFTYKHFLYNFTYTGRTSAKAGKRLSDEHRARMSAAHKGKKRAPFSDEHRARLSEAAKLYWAKRRQAAVDERLTCAS